MSLTLTRKMLEELTGQAAILEKFKQDLYGFMNRKFIPEYFLNSERSCPYALRNIGKIPTILFDPYERNDLQKGIKKAIINSFIADFEISDSRIFAGAGLEGDDALWGAWKIMSSVRENLYLIMMHGTHYLTTNVFLYEGGIEEYLNDKKRGKYITCEKVDNGKCIQKRLIELESNTPIFEFKEVFKKAKEDGALK